MPFFLARSGRWDVGEFQLSFNFRSDPFFDMSVFVFPLPFPHLNLPSSQSRTSHQLFDCLFCALHPLSFLFPLGSFLVSEATRPIGSLPRPRVPACVYASALHNLGRSNGPALRHSYPLPRLSAWRVEAFDGSRHSAVPLNRLQVPRPTFQVAGGGERGARMLGWDPGLSTSDECLLNSQGGYDKKTT